MNHQSIALEAAQPTPMPAADISIADHLIGSAIATAEAAGVPIEHVVAATLRAFIHLATATGATAAADPTRHFDALVAGMRDGKPFAILVSSHNRPEHKPFQALAVRAVWSSPPIEADAMGGVLKAVWNSPARAARMLLDAQRESADCPIGGYGQMTTVSAAGIEMKMVLPLGGRHKMSMTPQIIHDTGLYADITPPGGAGRPYQPSPDGVPPYVHRPTKTYASKVKIGNPNSKVRDNLLCEPHMWAISGGTGPTITPYPNDGAAMGPSENFFRLTSALAIGQQITFSSLPNNPCEPETLLAFSCRIRKYLPATTFSCTLSVDWYTIDSGGNAVFLSSAAGSSVAPLVSGVTVYLAKFSEFVPAGAAFFALKVVTAAAASATTYGIDFGGPTAIASQTCVVEKTYSLTTITIAPSTTSVIVTHVCNHTSSAAQVKLSFQMLHLSSGGRNLTIVFKKNGTTLWTMPTVHLDVDEQWNYDYLDEAITGSSSTYTVEVTAGGSSIDIGQRMMVTDAPLQ